MKEIILVSGFLGVGKTTLIQKFIDKLLLEKFLMIIENDFGDINIDRELLDGYSLEITEITSGCICCSLVGDFEKAIEDIKEKYDPDVIIIEPSGVADTSHLVNIILNDGYYRLNSINLIDGNSHFIYLDNFEKFYKNQILSANNIVINKTEKLSTGEINDMKNSIKAINDEASVYIDRIDMEIEKLLSEDSFIDKKELFFSETENIFRDYTSLSLILPNVYSFSYLEKSLEKIVEDERIERLKGILKSKTGPVRVDYTKSDKRGIIFSEIDDYNKSGKLVVIGDNFDKIRVRDPFRE